MGAPTVESTVMTRNMDSVFTLGQTDALTKAIGIEANSMGLVRTWFLVTKRLSTDSGKMENGLSGLAKSRLRPLLKQK